MFKIVRCGWSLLKQPLARQNKLVGNSMSNDTVENIIDFSRERKRRVHDLNEKRLQNVRAAFVSVLPLSGVGAKPKKKIKKKR